MKKVIWKFGPFWPGEVKKVMGRPINVGIQNANLFVWCEVNPEWAGYENTKENDEQIEWRNLLFTGTGVDYEGEYIGTVHTVASDGYPYVFHCIEVK